MLNQLSKGHAQPLQVIDAVERYQKLPALQQYSFRLTELISTIAKTFVLQFGIDKCSSVPIPFSRSLLQFPSRSTC